jgi:hypothetical protein
MYDRINRMDRINNFAFPEEKQNEYHCSKKKVHILYTVNYSKYAAIYFNTKADYSFTLSSGK